MAKIHTITSAHEREILTIWRDCSRLNISCANSRKFQRQRATPTGISDMPVLRSAYKIVRKRNRQRDKLDRYVSDTAQATAMLVRIELSWVYLLEMGRLIATKKRLWLSGWFFTLYIYTFQSVAFGKLLLVMRWNSSHSVAHSTLRNKHLNTLHT